jgi:hypothetical protein
VEVNMDDGTDADNDSEIAPGEEVIDRDGARVGAVRAAYPHYLAVEDAGPPPRAFRIPRHAIGGVEGGRVTLTVPTDALDPMTPSTAAAEGLPRHGDDPDAEQ